MFWLITKKVRLNFNDKFIIILWLMYLVLWLVKKNSLSLHADGKILSLKVNNDDDW